MVVGTCDMSSRYEKVVVPKVGSDVAQIGRCFHLENCTEIDCADQCGGSQMARCLGNIRCCCN